MEQITKADRDECHALCRKAKSAPSYGGLVPPLYALVKIIVFRIIEKFRQICLNMGNCHFEKITKKGVIKCIPKI